MGQEVVVRGKEMIEKLIEKYNIAISKNIVLDTKLVEKNIMFFIKKAQVRYLGNSYLVELWDKKSNYFCGVFDEFGNEVYIQKEVNDMIFRVDENNFYVFQRENPKNCSLIHYQYQVDDNKFKNEKIILPKNSSISEARVYCIDDDFVVFYLKDNGDGSKYFLYNQRMMKSLFSISSIDKEYGNYSNVTSGKYLLVTKKIVLDDNYATLLFFINKDGMIISDVFEYERATIYPVDVFDKPVESLEIIYSKVIRVLSEENKEKIELEQKRGYMRKFFKEQRVRDIEC